jgi:hypothetical protein
VKLYASMIINGSEGWGDGFPAMWFSEYLFSKNSGLLIDLYGAGNAESALTLASRLKYETMRLMYSDLYASRSTSRNAENVSKFTDQKKFDVTFFSINRIRNAIKLIGNKPFHHSTYIEKPPYISKWLFKPPSPTSYDEILLTHHNHSETELSWASPPLRDSYYGGLLPPMSVWRRGATLPRIKRMDLNSELLNIMLNEGFKPSMPELKRKVHNELLILPKRYVCIQLRPEDTGPLDLQSPTRNSLSGQKYATWANKFVAKCWEKWQLPIVFTSGFIESKKIETIDASRLSLWAKIETHRRAHYSYVAHSGFGMIVAVYRGLSDVKLLNPSSDGMYRNPPVILFSNVHDKIPSKEYTASSPGWVDQFMNWHIDCNDAMQP